jgi:hypothetical protein
MLRTALLVLFTFRLAAEIHPQFYFEWQKNAPEFLSIEVEGVEPKTLPRDEYFETRVRAKVVRVFRSASRVKKGSSIEIRYTVFQPRESYAGPRPLPYLKSGTRTVFYGRVMERTAEGIWIMEPVAGGRSFDTVSEEESNF